MYLPLNYENERRYIYKISIHKVCKLAISLPLFAFIGCVLLTMLKDFESANKTHCKVTNIFPSISASIGNYYPQTEIWKTAIYLHAPIRYYFIYLRWKYYLSVIRRDLYFIVNIAVILNVLENISLLGLTFWTSSLYYPYHEFCFKMFIGSSVLYMLLICILLTKYRRKSNVSYDQSYSLKVKCRAISTKIISFAIAAYCFLRHNRICEPYVYSMFSFAEYIVVMSNMIFHITTVYDIQPGYFYITKYGIFAENISPKIERDERLLLPPSDKAII